VSTVVQLPERLQGRVLEDPVKDAEPFMGQRIHERDGLDPQAVRGLVETPTRRVAISAPDDRFCEAIDLFQWDRQLVLEVAVFDEDVRLCQPAGVDCIAQLPQDQVQIVTGRTLRKQCSQRWVRGSQPVEKTS
jgi:hypothetical protein